MNDSIFRCETGQNIKGPIYRVGPDCQKPSFFSQVLRSDGRDKHSPRARKPFSRSENRGNGTEPEGIGIQQPPFPPSSTQTPLFRAFFTTWLRSMAPYPAPRLMTPACNRSMRNRRSIHSSWSFFRTLVIVLLVKFLCSPFPFLSFFCFPFFFELLN
jgi:hypothetical protein